MIVVHHLIVGRSVFTVWLLEELGLSYELIQYHRDAETRRAPPSLREIHPLGKSPLIVDDGLVLHESGAIATYLVDRYDTSHLLAPKPEEIEARARFVTWMHYPEGSAVLPLMLTMLKQMSPGPLPRLVDEFAASELALHLGFIRDSLGARPFITGDRFSAADVGLGYVCSLAERLGVVDDYPTLSEYADRLRNRPAFLRAVERSGG
jgi:glutathione S-transferase